MEKKTNDSYRKAIKDAYNHGYRAGWTAHEQLPNRKGARTAAKFGFSRGLSAHKKSDKYANRAKK